MSTYVTNSFIALPGIVRGGIKDESPSERTPEKCVLRFLLNSNQKIERSSTYVRTLLLLNGLQLRE